MSIRRRLATLLLVAIVPLVILSNIAVYLFVRHALLASLDDGLLARARALGASIKLEPEGLELDATPTGMTHYSGADSGEYFEIWRLDGASGPAIAFASDSLESRDIHPRVLDSPEAGWSATIQRGPSVRAASLAVRLTPQPRDEDDTELPATTATIPPDGLPIIIVVARSDRDYRSTLGLLGAALILAGAVMALGTLAAVWYAIDRGLAPIATLAGEVAAIQPEDVSGRVRETGLPRELAPLARRTNQLLARVGTAIQRERTLAASAAHELRTPIAEVRATCELSLQRERGSQEYRRALSQVLEITDRMVVSASAVLRLARIQAGREAPAQEAMDLRAAIQPPWQRWIEPLSNRGVRSRLDLPARTHVLADPAMLRVVFDNLCANIAEHTPPGGRVTLALIDDDRGAERLKSNGHGSRPGPQETRGHVGIRLTNTVAIGAGAEPSPRSPPTVSFGTPHVGLGLVTAEQMLKAQGGWIHAGQVDDQFVATLMLPRATRTPA